MRTTAEKMQDFIDPTQPQNATRLLKYLSGAMKKDVSVLKESPRPTKGGIENRNYYISAIADGAHLNLVLRCPPAEIPEWRQGYGLYDLEREFRILQELPSLEIGLPTPLVYGYDAGETFGVPCFLMECLPGERLNYHFQPSYNEALICEYIDAVVAVSTIAYESSPWLKENLPKWTLAFDLKWKEAKSRRFHSDPLCHYVLSWLQERLPPSRTLVMCQGDPNPSNFLVEDDCISGVVDWEFSCVTDDPLGQILCVGWLHDRKELREVFCHAMDREASELGWHEVSGLFGAVYINYNQDRPKHRRELAEMVGYRKV